MIKTIDGLRLFHELGGGQFGTVYLWKLKKGFQYRENIQKLIRPGRKVACKMIKIKNINPALRKYIDQEITIIK